MSPFPKEGDFVLLPRNYTGLKHIELEIKISLVASGLNFV
jgi:hypothetical protein